MESKALDDHPEMLEELLEQGRRQYREIRASQAKEKLKKEQLKKEKRVAAELVKTSTH